MQVFQSRLANKGFSVQRSQVLSAKSREGTIHIDPSGLSWSAFDPADAVLPAMPDVLRSPKEPVRLKELAAKYFRAARSGGTTTLQLVPRVESSSRWAALRASDECGLAPDEHEVASFLIRQAGGTCRMVTDFPNAGSVVAVYGRKLYYDSTIGSAEAVSTLRAVGKRASRNSYLRRGGALELSGILSPSREDLAELFEGLGEWCSFTAA